MCSFYVPSRWEHNQSLQRLSHSPSMRPAFQPGLKSNSCIKAQCTMCFKAIFEAQCMPPSFIIVHLKMYLTFLQCFPCRPKRKWRPTALCVFLCVLHLADCTPVSLQAVSRGAANLKFIGYTGFEILHWVAAVDSSLLHGSKLEEKGCIHLGKIVSIKSVEEEKDK